MDGLRGGLVLPTISSAAPPTSSSSSSSMLIDRSGLTMATGYTTSTLTNEVPVRLRAVERMVNDISLHRHAQHNLLEGRYSAQLAAQMQTNQHMQSLHSSLSREVDREANMRERAMLSVSDRLNDVQTGLSGAMASLSGLKQNVQAHSHRLIQMESQVSSANASLKTLIEAYVKDHSPSIGHCYLSSFVFVSSQPLHVHIFCFSITNY